MSLAPIAALILKKGRVHMTYAIFEENMERLEKKLTRISNKCSKYGCAFTFNVVGEEFREVNNEKGRIVNLRFVIVEAEGVARLNGWRFIASVEHTPNGNIINRADYGVEVPHKYYDTETFCDHCLTNRARKDTYIVMNEETGEFKQVGKSCLADFTGGLSASNIASYYSYFEELIQGESVDFGGGYSRYYDKAELVRFYAETIRKFGFVKKSDEGRSTADRGFEYWMTENEGGWFTEKDLKDLRREMQAVNFNQDSPEAVADAEAALLWVAEQDESNNYIHNLKTICGMEYVTYKHLGILASLFAAWKRDIIKEEERREREQKKAEQRKISNHVGDVGQRFTFNVNSFELVTSWETEWGVTFLYKMTDTTGNVLIWKSSKWIDDLESVQKITGTVKAHSEFNMIQQTEITRCKVA